MIESRPIGVLEFLEFMDEGIFGFGAAGAGEGD